MICHVLLILIGGLPLPEKKQRRNGLEGRGEVGGRNEKIEGRGTCGQNVKLKKSIVIIFRVCVYVCVNAF